MRWLLLSLCCSEVLQWQRIRALISTLNCKRFLFIAFLLFRTFLSISFLFDKSSMVFYDTKKLITICSTFYNFDNKFKKYINELDNKLDSLSYCLCCYLNAFRSSSWSYKRILRIFVFHEVLCVIWFNYVFGDSAV